MKYLCQGFKMRNLYLLSLMVMCALVFTGCGPKYLVQKTYHSPLNSHECLEVCAKENTICESNQILDYEDCVAKVSYEARSAYHDALDSYGKQTKHYEMSLWRYERALEAYTHSVSCLTCKKDDKKCKALHVSKPNPPKTPIAPNFEDIVKHYIASCTPTNRCEIAYEACFSACGGHVQLHEHCISGCD